MTDDEPSSKPVYFGDVLITEFDTEDLEALNAELEEMVDVEEGEELYVSLPSGERLEVRKLRERSR